MGREYAHLFLYCQRCLVCLAALACLMALVWVLPVYAQKTPEQDAAAQVVTNFLEGFVEVTSQDGLSVQEQLSVLLPNMHQNFDVRRLAISTVGYSRWKSWMSQTQKEYEESLVRYLVCSYIRRFEGTGGDVWEIRGVEETQGRILIAVSLRRQDTLEGHLSFLLLRRETRWKIVDVFLDNKISEVANWRSQFAGTLREGGVEALLERLGDLVRACEASSENFGVQ